ncbi:energy transducer TonB [Mucilaginibacter conchicola]|nr:energy transducer TonB [Mucilaginibacter conchicola]
MRAILVFVCCIVFACSAYAQDAGKLIKSDTINLRGIVYDHANKPVSGLSIGFAPGNFHPPGFPISTSTDKNGNFELKGAAVNDKLIIIDGRYAYRAFENKGSRFMVIYLPSRKVIAISDTIRITADRQTAKSTSLFKVAGKENKEFDGVTDIKYPSPLIGESKLYSFINENLKYPSKAIAKNIEGLVEIGFIVDVNGVLNNVKVLKGIGYGCEEEVKKILLKAGKWRPGICAGQYFAIEQSISVIFSLKDKKI